jgi:hypothetical protein
MLRVVSCRHDCAQTVAPACKHLSQQNTFTGRLTEEMFDGVVNHAKRIALLEAPAHQQSGQ